MPDLQPTDPTITAFMAIASSALNVTLPTPKEVFAFCDDMSELSDKLLRLALEGKKTATTTWPIPEPLPWGVGDLSVILDGRGEPKAVMRTTELVTCKFKDVAEDFALAEAEGDYEAWRKGHVWFFKQQDEREQFDDESMVLCERFVIIYPQSSVRN